VTVPSQILEDERLLEWRLEGFAEFGVSAAEFSELAAVGRKDRDLRGFRLSLGRHHPNAREHWT